MTTIEQFIAKTELAEPWHNRRFAKSFQIVQPLLTRESAVLCLGMPGTFEALLREFIGCSVESTGETDLRYITTSTTYDLILCMEVIEHVRDQEGGDVATFTASGILNMLKFAHESLKPGGKLFLTTPNVNSWRNLWLWMKNLHPYMFPPHHRELCKKDVQDLMKKSGKWTEELAMATDCWSNHGCSAEQVGKMFSMMRGKGVDCSAETRADDLFFVYSRI
jgi:SAM-dependent methyltransferase